MIIGGGHSAVDAARVALRLGADESYIIYRRSRTEMLAEQEEVEEAEREGVKILFQVAPLRITGENGLVNGIECIRTRLMEADTTGRRKPIPVEGSEFIIDSDVIIPAISQEPDISMLKEDHTFEISRWHSFVVDEKTMATNVPGFFAGGDAVTGPATVVQAIAAGHRAAVSIDCYLSGREYAGYRYPRPHLVVDRVETSEEDERIVRPKMRELAVADRRGSFQEVELGIEELAAFSEARRCLRCDL